MVCMHARAVEVCRLENYTVIAPVIGGGYVEVDIHTGRTSKVSAVVDFVLVCGVRVVLEVGR